MHIVMASNRAKCVYLTDSCNVIRDNTNIEKCIEFTLAVQK